MRRKKIKYCDRFGMGILEWNDWCCLIYVLRYTQREKEKERAGAV